MKMSQISLRIDQDLKENAYDKIKNFGTTPSDLIRDIFKYIVQENKLPIRKKIISAEDAELLSIVKSRLKEPAKLKKVTFDELLQ
ncbi:type II toxin-antitoxin system RelB/DinJ family antitoxin [Zymomonas mobilis]|uniref:Addiction module antitoxin, RelB/DinJ family n=1 Tax=Zymomonas mobilis subsp. mobilis (strain ATCC 10988 / DSM 424 / LMG 404 / NCIMB 8938 / NRRL B-806 / ZM1) TaxID=555217 RepID=A0A0H3G0V2_ZYMMA|nr:type II toxin-antitoxin system RelB/DinJ family antitoxin [Zymomonas mobilis]AEH63641.1 addiction module antitoxin, RelB/DinJ family [Zymomonas mobilis subsp. mobilis ATCC 10988]TQL24934.1 RHH-type rel operon transcriptional repressor/antitoxin RelB [Zymomonas mobilis]